MDVSLGKKDGRSPEMDSCLEWKAAYPFCSMLGSSIARRAYLVDNFVDICRMDWPLKSPDLIHIEHARDVLGWAITTNKSPPKTIQGLEIELLNA
ncbi:hypothetical protein TNCV_3578801 [Trichonephila clavipes]|nr:hypothetical protein TNCV_3578801 [Trichonephila clavipes]